MTDPDRPRLVLHSGTFKTGSSAIQLYLNRAQHHGLLATVGAEYPKLGRTTGIQHDNLVAELRQDERMFRTGHGGWDALLAHITSERTPTTIVSSESFSRLTAPEMADLGDRCRRAGVAVTWIHYVRDQPGFHNAFYVERLLNVRGDLAGVVDQPFEEFGRWSPIDLGFLRYASFAEAVLGAVSGVELVLRPFDRALLVGHDSVQDFCQVVGLPFDPSYAGETNVGVGWRSVETSRRLFPVVRAFDVAAHVRHAPNRAFARARWLQLIRSELVAATSAVGWNDASAVYLTTEHRQHLLAEHHDENVRLDAMVDFDWVSSVQSATPRPFNVGDFSEVAPEELFSVLARVLRVVHEMPAEVERLIAEAAPSRGPAPDPSFARRALRAARQRLGD